MISAPLVLAIVAMSAYAWIELPADAQLPVHFDIHGNPDRFDGKGMALGIVPVTALFMGLLLSFIPKLEPRQFHMADSMKAYSIIVGTIMVFFTIIHGVLILRYLEIAHLPMTAVLGVSMGAMFAIIGNVMGKTRSNFFMGIRTPWTLSSEESWSRTHRLGGYLFMGTGMLTMITGILNYGTAMLVVLLGGLIPGCIFLVVYSYIVWKNDPNRTN